MLIPPTNATHPTLTRPDIVIAIERVGSFVLKCRNRIGRWCFAVGEEKKDRLAHKRISVWRRGRLFGVCASRGLGVGDVLFMNPSQNGHLHTQTGEHLAVGEFTKDTEVQGTFHADGPYPDVRANVLYELKFDGGSTIGVLEVQKDPDDRNHIYHLKLKPQGVSSVSPERADEK